MKRRPPPTRRAGPAPPGGAASPAIPARARDLAVIAGLAASLIALLAHARAYLFLTDDAFISFRYARNLARGLGLVFNPGGERVEGFTNLLWVLILAALDRVGIPPERAAPALSLAMTAGLWLVVVGFAWRTHGSPRLSWVVLVPAFALAATRSVAVWSSGGLETRMFELLLVGALLRLVIELEAARTGAGRRAVSPWLFALATLTRPDGLLLSLSACGVAAIVLGRERRAFPARFLAGWLPFAVLVGAQFVFRRLYYGAWLPNTYHAKVGGQVSWESGLAYLSAWALEYAAYLWIPLLAGAVLFHRRRGTGVVPLMFAAVVLPHLVYVAAIGGDHFEYRPLDLCFPLIFLLLGDGAREWAGRLRVAAVAPAWVGVVLVGLFALPYQSHRQFPPAYIPGFPGTVERRVGRYMEPDDDPLYRLPGLRQIAARHRHLLGELTRRYAGIRQEEHRMFLANMVEQGRGLRRLVDRGVLPADFHIATHCVGAMPYYSDLRFLDRLGLTDAGVARSGFVTTLVAHGKRATLEYARARGVDLWNLDDVHTLVPVTSADLLATIVAAQEPAGAASTGRTRYIAFAGDDQVLLGLLPQGLESVRARAPRLTFRELRDPAFLDEFVAKAAAAHVRAAVGDSAAARHLRERLRTLLTPGGAR